MFTMATFMISDMFFKCFYINICSLVVFHNVFDSIKVK